MKEDIYIRNINRINKWFEESKENYILLDIKLQNNKIKIFVKCPIKEHKPYWVDWQHFYNRGDRCSKCRYLNNSKKRLIYNYNKIKEIVEENGYELISENINGIETIIIIKDDDGYYYQTSPYRLMKKHFPYAFDTVNPYTIQNIYLWCKLNNKPFKLISNTYKKSSKKLQWKCLNEGCNKEFSKEWNPISRGIGCPYCSGRLPSENNNLLVKNPILAEEWDYIKNYPLTPKDVLPNCTKKFWWICKECGHTWKQSVHFRNQRNNSCPICTKSKGEKRIIYFLNKYNIKYIQQYKFDDCKNKKKLPFDFYLPDYKYCIEYQGEYHYKIIKGMTTNEVLQSQQKRDQIKRNYCDKNNIKLIEIPYWEFNNIEQILLENYIAKDVYCYME